MRSPDANFAGTCRAGEPIRPRSTPPRGRRGVTLLEVLISVFVLMVGLLGLFALFPVGTYEMSRAERADRSSALGRAAIRDLMVRGWLHPKMWMDPNGVTPVLMNFNGSPVQYDLNGQIATHDGLGNPLPFNDGAKLSFPPPFAIDPLALSAPQNQALIPGDFPNNHGGLNTISTIKRLTVRAIPPQEPVGLGPFSLSYAQAERVLRSNDDLNFFKPDNPELLPRQVFHRDAANNAISRQFKGDYSWLITVSPSVAEMFNGANTVGNAYSTRQYQVSIVVYYKRDLALNADPGAGAAPLERNVLVDFAGLGYAGGDVILKPGPNGAKSWLNLQPGQWVMLSGLLSATGPKVSQWYRVVAMAPDDPSSTSRRATLAGPDWPLYPPVVPPPPASPFIDVDSDPMYHTAYCTICEGVVGVYEKTMTLEGISSWTN